MNTLKKRLRNGEVLTGCWLNLGSSVTAEIVGLSGFDWVLIDLEHGAGTENELLTQLQTLAHAPAAAVVRVESHARERIHRALDFGAQGVMAPKVSNPQEAGEVAGALMYPPSGVRGVARMVRATQFGNRFQEYHRDARDEILGIVQIETLEALDHLDAIAAVPGVDILFIGPSDLTMAMGIYGDFDHPEYLKAVEATAEAAHNEGKSAGILLSDPTSLDRYLDLGYTFVACGADSAFVVKGAKEMAGRLNSLRDQKLKNNQKK